ncbi:MAG TPA: DUF4038 domain-containing protein [Patescibacteria group bacterium]|nr:DUF4038 domain-containing protein [Patescibacteria group bacterium]
MNRPLAILTALLLAAGAARAQAAGQWLTASANAKYLMNSQTGSPVFLTGDAPQLLFTQISNADVDLYLADRAARGFNAIWVYPIDNQDQNSAPQNFYGNVPFAGADFTNENATYWSHVDYVLGRIQAYGLVAFMNVAFVGTPQFGTSYYYTSILNSSSTVLTNYGAFLGNRYKSYPNIVWVLGGDAPPATAGMYTQIGYIGAGIAAADPNHLITLEGCRACTGVVTNGQQSTLEAYSVAGVSAPSWIVLNWAYAKAPNVISECNAAYAATSGGAVPPLMGEDSYELDSSTTVFQARAEGWQEILSGCYLGRLFGNDAIWTFNSTPTGGSSQPSWKTQLGSPVSVAQQIMGALFNSRSHWLFVPDTPHSVLTGGLGSGQTASVAACTSDGVTCIVYDPLGSAQAPQIAMGHFSGAVHAWWFNPQNGAVTSLGTLSNSGTSTFTPANGSDWVLVLDLASAGLHPPAYGWINPLGHSWAAVGSLSWAAGSWSGGHSWN